MTVDARDRTHTHLNHAKCAVAFQCADGCRPKTKSSLEGDSRDRLTIQRVLIIRIPCLNSTV
jgi:hypothetical protein